MLGKLGYAYSGAAICTHTRSFSCREFSTILPSSFKTRLFKPSPPLNAPISVLATSIFGGAFSRHTFRIGKEMRRTEFDYSLECTVEYCLRPSKPIIDEIDRVLARHYGFTDEELDFIINYDIKYRIGKDADSDEGDE